MVLRFMKKNREKNIKYNHYSEGFFTNVASDTIEPGINEKIIKKISKKRNEPDWMLKFRVQSYKDWINMREPHWINGFYKPINYQKYSYYSAPSNFDNLKNNKNKFFTKEIQNTFVKLGVPIHEKSSIAVDAVFDSVSVITTQRKELEKFGIIFCSFSEAIQRYSNLVKKYIGKAVSSKDNFFSALNSSVVSDGTFVYIPKMVQCPIELSTYFRINEKKIGQFERTIIIAEEGSNLSYIEGCSASENPEYQLHAAVVEIFVHRNATVKYSTIQNWSTGNKKGGILNFVTKRAICIGKNSKMSWIQSEIGSAITWKYPSIILKGKNAIGEFYSITSTKGTQQADTGTKMIHIGKNTKSVIISKSIASERSKNTYRGLVKICSSAKNSKNYTQCDSIMFGNKCSTYSYPNIETKIDSSQLEHEAYISKINEDQLFYCLQRGINKENSVSIIINGFCKEITEKMPLEFSIEIQKILSNI
ncbi:cysteine desulfurase [Candidatus Riesia sp. GBBU]|nr:cysteine desulfurase [Candidatus Riesia sp. GBBU]